MTGYNGEPKEVFAVNGDDTISQNKRGLTWIQMKTFFQQPGCVLCHMVATATHQRVNFILYEYVLDPYVRQKLHASFGFCPRHTVLAEIVEQELQSDGQHLGTLYETLLVHEMQQIQAGRQPSEASPTGKKLLKRKPIRKYPADPVRQRLTPSEDCMVCRSEQESEVYYAMIMADMYQDPEFQGLYEQEHVLLCRQHFVILLNELKEDVAVDYFIRWQMDKLSRLHRQLTLFLDKHDVRRAQEPHGEEWDSWKKTLDHFSGTKDNFQQP